METFIRKYSDDWVVHRSCKYPDKVYYFNIRTGQSTWIPPTDCSVKEDHLESVEDEAKNEADSSTEHANSYPKTPAVELTDRPFYSTNTSKHFSTFLKVTNGTVEADDNNISIVHQASAEWNRRKEGQLLQKKLDHDSEKTEHCVDGQRIITKNNRNTDLSKFSTNIKLNAVSGKRVEDNTFVRQPDKVILKRSWQSDHKKPVASERPPKLDNCTVKNVVDRSSNDYYRNLSNSVVEQSGRVMLKRSWRCDNENGNVQLQQDSGAKKKIIVASSSNSASTNLTEGQMSHNTDTERGAAVRCAAQQRLLNLRRTLSQVRDQKLERSNRLIPRTSLSRGDVSKIVTENNISSRTSVTSETNVTRNVQTAPQKKIEIEERLDEKTTGDVNVRNLAASRMKNMREKLETNQSDVRYHFVSDIQSDDDDEYMVLAEEDMLIDVQNLREEINQAGGVSHKEIEEMIYEIIPNSFPETIASLYVVLDTNVLLSDLQYLQDLLQTKFKGIGYLVFIIPWMVLHELDLLKDRRDITKIKLTAIRAKNAIKFLHSCFSSKHPRVIGQTVADAGPDALTGLMNPDNSILHCCLLQIEKGRKVVLLSDDQNLRNKSMVNGIDAIGKEEIHGYLNTCGRINVGECNANTVGNTDQNVATTEVRADHEENKVLILLDFFKRCLKDVLSKIITCEMKSVYDKDWMVVICVKPPWELKDLLTCISRHWIAVFGQILRRDNLRTVKELEKCLINGGYKYTLQELKNMIIKCARFLGEFKKPCYTQLVREAQSYLQDLIADCENSLSSSIVKQNIIFSDPSVETAVSKHDVVITSIEKICLCITKLCQQLQSLVGNNHGHSQNTPTGHQSLHDLKVSVAYFYEPLATILRFTECFSSDRFTSSSDSDIQSVYEEFCGLYKLVSHGEDIAFTVEQFFEFCTDNETRASILKLFQQFGQFKLIMERAIDYFTHSDLPSCSSSSVPQNLYPNDVEMEEQS